MVAKRLLCGWAGSHCCSLWRPGKDPEIEQDRIPQMGDAQVLVLYDVLKVFDLIFAQKHGDFSDPP